MTTQSAATTPTTTRTLDPEVQPASVRPSWTAAQKLALLAEYEAFPHGSAERGAFLRRNGLYTSHMSKWRRLRNQGALAGLAPQARGPKPAPQDPLVAENARLQGELARVQARLTQAEAVIEIQKKVAQLLGSLPLATTPVAP
jgi:transposase-like protein